ncbi:hypothetical protein Cgig2_017316 [Carnegiea gigantea]|uniref:Uncharacterized protein n=1 Tax=Carnegiea gigantea TaxID=171969 RepID=A0A9Q1QCX2_9CARY|nr:hypothetical protein Cgig2_017316 [Carnegiea gigantea]
MKEMGHNPREPKLIGYLTTFRSPKCGPNRVKASPWARQSGRETRVLRLPPPLSPSSAATWATAIAAQFRRPSRRFRGQAAAHWDEYQRLKLNASHSGVEVNDDALFLQAAGGVNSKGLVYGLGNQTQTYYERVGPSTQSSPSTPIAYAPSMYAQIVSRLQKSEEQLNATREELTRTKEEVKQTKDAIARIESRFGSSSS